MTQYEVALPIACVEGWSQMANWKGPRLKEVMREVGASAGSGVRAISLEQGSSYAKTEMEPEFAHDDLTLVALELNGEVLDIDHGYPARMIAPARPGVLQTKWLSSLEAI
jgi:DMSO/TMAO reductase YedYZ molybdopterin-dependent catalytic subunit